MLYRDIIAVCSESHTKHINTLCGQNVGLLNVKLAVRKVTSGQQTASQIPNVIVPSICGRPSELGTKLWLTVIIRAVIM